MIKKIKKKDEKEEPEYDGLLSMSPLEVDKEDVKEGIVLKILIPIKLLTKVPVL